MLSTPSLSQITDTISLFKQFIKQVKENQSDILNIINKTQQQCSYQTGMKQNNRIEEVENCVKDADHSKSEETNVTKQEKIHLPFIIIRSAQSGSSLRKNGVKKMSKKEKKFSSMQIEQVPEQTILPIEIQAIKQVQ